MAVPRVPTQSSVPLPWSRDSRPEWQAADRLVESLRAEHEAASEALKAATEAVDDGVTSQAAVDELTARLLAGQDVTIDTPETESSVNLSSLKAKVVRLAKRLREAEAARTAINRKLCTELSDSLRSDDDRDARELLAALQSVLAIRSRRLARRAAINSAFDGSCGLPTLDVPQTLLGPLQHGLDAFRSSMVSLGIEVQN
ncbi:hypothetical protein [Planctellipticum variicoloris]|uniref:hypothetical protein n=1 Tax=Planctellipticum variicoloris TaxID=3064265 RepID=UPI003013607D|nr:hypothetical protein SH412_003277 [Planctomycetaceae bacterium SH412]